MPPVSTVALAASRLQCGPYSGPSVDVQMLNSDVTQALANHLLCEAREDGYALGRTRLVKLFYLIDLEHYRWHGQTLTGADWQYYHYGPYDGQLVAAIEQTPGVEFQPKEQIDEGREFIDYEVQERTADYDRLRPDVRAIAQRVYGRWVGGDLQSLLSHVYFETPPMQAARRGEYLDFATVPQARDETIPAPVPDYDAGIPEERRQVLIEMLRARRSGARGLQTRPSSEGYLLADALRAMDEEDRCVLQEGSVQMDEETKRRLTELDEERS